MKLHIVPALVLLFYIRIDSAHQAGMSTIESINRQDTLISRQDLYNGKVWVNRFRYARVGQFMFADYYLDGTVYFNGKKYENILLRYDAHGDEVLTPMNDFEIIQLNREMLDSFSIRFDNKFYRFVNAGDTGSQKGFRGYMNVLYKGHCSLYIKYRKVITTDFNDKNLVDFYLYSQLFLTKDNRVIPLTDRDDLLSCFPEYSMQIKEYIKKTGLKVSIKKPESVVRLVRFIDSLKDKS